MIKSVKEAEAFVLSISKGLAASLSAYLIALAVVSGGLVIAGREWIIGLAIVSVVFLGGYIVVESFKSKMGIASNSSYPAFIFSIGFVSGLFAYSFILGSLSPYFFILFWGCIVAVSTLTLFFVKGGPALTYEELSAKSHD